MEQTGELRVSYGFEQNHQFLTQQIKQQSGYTGLGICAIRISSCWWRVYRRLDYCMASPEQLHKPWKPIIVPLGISCNTICLQRSFTIISQWNWIWKISAVIGSGFCQRIWRKIIDQTDCLPLPEAIYELVFYEVAMGYSRICNWTA